MADQRELTAAPEDARAAARLREGRHAHLLEPIRWARSDRATLSEYSRLRDKAKVHGVESLTAEELERCRRYVEHHDGLVREARRARAVYARLPARQQREFRNWTPREFLAYRRACTRPQYALPVTRPRTRSVRRTTAPTRGDPSPSGEDSPEPPPPSRIWLDLAAASARMVAHEARREARWRKGAPV